MSADATLTRASRDLSQRERWNAWLTLARVSNTPTVVSNVLAGAALAGVLDQRSFDDPAQRAWIFRTIGRGHDRTFWASFVAGLRSVGYDDVLSIENEDVTQTPVEGVEEAAAFMSSLIA